MDKDSSQIQALYLQRTQRVSSILQMAPFLRCLILNGSLTQGAARAESDIDILVIGQYGRLFTVRFFVVVLAALLGVKRAKDETRPHNGKFCFNYFMSDSRLKIPTGRGLEMDNYCAQNYSQSILIWGEEKIFKRFLRQNKKLFQSQRSKPDLQNNRANLGPFFPIKTTIFYLWSRLAALILSGWLGDRLERGLKHIQVKKIEADPRTKKYPDLIVYSDRELRFHPPKGEAGV